MTAKKNWEFVDPNETRKMPERCGGPFRCPDRRYKASYKPLHLKRNVQISFHVTLEEYHQIENHCRLGSSRLSRSTLIRRWILEGLAHDN